MHHSGFYSTAVYTGAQKSAENIPTLDFCNYTNRSQLVCLYLFSLEDKEAGNHFLLIIIHCSFT